MKRLIILTILLTSAATHAFPGEKTHRNYARWFENLANSKIKHSIVSCWDKDANGYYTCELIKVSRGVTAGYEEEFEFLTHHLREMNANVEKVYQIPMLILGRSKDVTI